MVASRKQRAAAAAQKVQAQPVVPRVPAQPPMTVPPSPDPVRLELYYKVRDDLKEQISTAETRALAILTIELALFVAIATLTPLIVSHIPKHKSPQSASPPAHPPLLWVNLTTEIIFFIALALIILWLMAATISIWLMMIDVLRADFTVPTVSKRKFLVSY